MGTIERFDSHAHLRNGLRAAAAQNSLWAGIPMPLEGETLVVEPNYPNAEILMKIGNTPFEPQPERDKVKVRSRFWSMHKRAEIVIFEKPEGGVDWGLVPGFHHLQFDLRTLGCADAWGIEQEANAVQTLAGLVRHRQFKQYLLTGMFLESSKRSGVSYLFRRLKPTVAIKHDLANDSTSIMCCLCQHPIAYYAESWAGAMCPTDDVIAALSLMRGDESMFWKRSTQHPSWLPQAGL